MKERKRLLKTYACLYRRSKDFDLDRCAYCGSPRECLDHVPPLYWIESFDLSKRKEKEIKLVLYPSCGRCNSWLGDKPLFNYQERIAFLYNRYGDEIEKQKGLWTEDEIAELGYSLQVMVRARKSYIDDLIKSFRNVEENICKWNP